MKVAGVRGVASCSVADMYERFRGICCFLLYPDDKGNKFLLNALPDYTASRSRRQLTLASGRNSDIQIFWKINLCLQVRL